MSNEDAPLTYEELEEERDRLAGELYNAKNLIDDLMTEIRTLRNPTSQTIPTKFDQILITTSAASHTGY